MLEDYIDRLIRREDLSEEDAAGAMAVIMAGEATEAQIAGFLVALRMKGETVAEITGCAEAMREAAVPIDAGGLEVVDTCGTGGDRTGTFNVSTAAAIVAAGAGVPVAKHGNRSVSSGSGSADVLAELGVDIQAPVPVVERCIREAGLGFLFAPSLHKAMRYAIGPRRELGVRTVFNILGPLTNPARTQRQVLGVFSEELVEPMARVLKGLGAVRAMVVHSDDGLDELSISDASVIAEVDAADVRVRRITPEDVGITRVPLDELLVEDPAHSAQVIRSMLAGDEGPVRDMALLNAAAAICVGGHADSLRMGILAASDAVDSGRAAEVLEKLVAITNSPE